MPMRYRAVFAAAEPNTVGAQGAVGCAAVGEEVVAYAGEVFSVFCPDGHRGVRSRREDGHVTPSAACCWYALGRRRVRAVPGRGPIIVVISPEVPGAG